MLRWVSLFFNCLFLLLLFLLPLGPELFLEACVLEKLALSLCWLRLYSQRHRMGERTQAWKLEAWKVEGPRLCPISAVRSWCDWGELAFRLSASRR